MNWLHYLLEANIYLAVFYAGYCLFLNRETHYNLNRVYLLLSCVLSFALPVIQIGVLKPAENVQEITWVSSPADSTTVPPVAADYITWDNALWAVYIIGISVLALLLVIKLFKLVNLTTSGKRIIDNKYKLIDIEDADTAFSFFNYLFIGTKTSASDIIIRHELVHIRQKHSFDIVFIEVIKIINWFNPIIYLLQISLKTVHEYIADEQTAAHEADALAYSSFLVNNAYGLNGSSITHSFFNYNLLKKRIIMLNQQRSGNLARLKYLVAVPICAGMLCASTLAFSKNYAFIDLAPKTAKPTLTVPKTATADTSNRKMRTRSTTSKGYAYDETGYLINNKTDFRVIITDKNGDQKEYYKSKAKPAELAMLKEKYGYSFPKMMIYPKLPPPPPMPPGAQPDMDRMPPPPPAPPKHGAKHLRMPPPAEGADVNRTPPPPPPAPPVVSRDINKMPPPPPVPPVGSGDINRMPPPPPVPPVYSKDTVGMPVAPQPGTPPQAPKPAKALKLKPVSASLSSKVTGAKPVKLKLKLISATLYLKPAPAVSPAEATPEAN
ncbi:M56 family metallopeptidase [Mucilaginibacter sp. KACC 22773]|uniref:M56 family metallopeptidase n=1 Tax=Mucilaginibacter sp. KACC 22773 TaxID=3025671 RepID=UPI0023654311|nr:M56 family metallopeptidase [Mucilaginibacter sp. KACC 22773]WDF80124.1 M56 family metallopeptidase [Mucilaginibacter sp. KACC 22773]